MPAPTPPASLPETAAHLRPLTIGNRYEGRVAVITGAASGLGEATARLLVAEGGRVVVADYGAERGQAVGRIDGVFATTKHAARVLQAGGDGGSIVMTSSVAGVQGGLGPHAYTVARSGVIGLARSAAAELAAHRIRVSAIAPGSIPTGMTAHVMTGDPDALEKTTERIGQQSPLGRAGMPADIAEAALYLLSDAGSYMTGQTLVVDAGLTSGTSMSPTWAKTTMVVAR